MNYTLSVAFLSPAPPLQTYTYAPRAHLKVHSSRPLNDFGTLETLKHRMSSGSCSLSLSLPYCDIPAFVKVSWGRRSFAAATVFEACTPLSVRLVLVSHERGSRGSGGMMRFHTGRETTGHSSREQRVSCCCCIAAAVVVWQLFWISLHPPPGGPLRRISKSGGDSKSLEDSFRRAETNAGCGGYSYSYGI